MTTYLDWLRFSLLTTIGFVFAGCAGNSSPPLPADLDLSKPVATGEVRAGKIDDASELIGGPTARGRVGDFKLYNSKVAFIIGKGGSADGYSPWGGKVLDADRVRAPGEAGRSSFGEWMIGFDQRVCAAEKVTVISDGTRGGPAVVRVEGADASIPLIDILLDGILPTGPQNAWITIDFILEPDVNYLRTEVTFAYRGDDKIKVSMRQHAFFMGDGAQPWQSGIGFGERQGTVPFYAAIAPDVSYGIFDEKPITFLVNYNSLRIATQGSFELFAGQKLTFTSYLVVGDGDSVSLERYHAQATGKTRQVATVNGILQDGAGAGIGGARVHAIRKVSGEDLAEAVARTGPDGSYSVDLPAGSYQLRATFFDRPPSPAVPLTVEATGGITTGPNIVASASGTLHYSVTDDAQRALPAKITVRALPGTPTNTLSAIYGAQRFASSAAHISYAHTGSGQVRLAPGRYRVWASRGFEYTLGEQEVAVVANGSADAAFTLSRVVDTTGYLSGDFHIHAQASPDSDDLNDLKVASFAAEGLEVPIATDHEVVTDYRPHVTKLGLDAWIQPIVGEEVTTFTLGHFNAYPLAYDPSKRNNGFIEWYYKSGPEIFAAIRANPANPVVQLNHPRSPAIGGYFSAVGYDPATGSVKKPGDWSTNFDVIEVMNGKSYAGPHDGVFPDWYSFLNQGLKPAAVGNSDSHNSLSGAQVAYPRNFVQVPSDDLADFNEGTFIDSVRAGRVIVSGGLFLTASILGMGPGSLVTVPGDEVAIKVTVQAPPWMSANQLIVVANGVTVLDRAIAAGDADSTNPAIRLRETIHLPLTRDTWFVVHARGPGSLDPVVTGARPYAFSNAIFVDRDGNGQFDAPGLGGGVSSP